MKLVRVCGCMIVAVSSIAGCDSSDPIPAEPSSRPAGSRPTSSVEIDVFNDVIAAAKQAPQVAASGSANLLTNPGFEDGVGGWNSCASGSLNVSKDAYQGTQALQLDPDNCIYRSVQIVPGGTYVLSCKVKIDPSKAWTGMGMVFANSDYVSLLDAPVATATGSEYMTLTSKGTAPAATSFVSMWVHSDFGALVDSCSLMLEADQPTVTPDTGNLLDNSGFDLVDVKGDLESWTSGCNGEIVTSDTNITLTNGACVDQSLNIVAVKSIKNSAARYGCYISKSEGYSDLSVYLDGKLAATHQIENTQSNTFVSVDVDASTASNGFVTLYSEGTLTAENCTFDTAGIIAPDTPADGSTAVVFESPRLEEIVKSRLSITDGSVARDDMLLLTSLSNGALISPDDIFDPADVVSLSGLEYAVNLETIDLQGISVDSLAPLAGLTSLQTIALKTTSEFSDISIFAEQSFPALTVVIFRGSSSISDLTPLNGYNLRSLGILDGKVTDPSPVSSMSEMQWMVLTGSTLTNLQSLADGTIYEAATGLSRFRPQLRISSQGLDLSENTPDRLALEALKNRKSNLDIELENPSDVFPPTLTFDENFNPQR